MRRHGETAMQRPAARAHCPGAGQLGMQRPFGAVSGRPANEPPSPGAADVTGASGGRPVDWPDPRPYRAP